MRTIQKETLMKTPKSNLAFAAASLLVSVSALSAQITLFHDTFNRANDTDINLNSAADQSGTIGAQLYDEFTGTGATDPQISGGRLLLGPGTGNQPANQSRAALDYNLFGSAATITGLGAFEVAYTVNPGVSYEGPENGHGTYSFRTYISQASVSKALTATGSTFQSLAVEVRGNGQVLMYSEGSQINTTTTASVWNTQADNSVRILVETNGFSTSSTNTASIFINDTLVGSARTFDWTKADDVYLALEATNQSSSFENLSITAVPEPSTYGMLAGALVLTWVMVRRRK
jgi:hypothetical protein